MLVTKIIFTFITMMFGPSIVVRCLQRESVSAGHFIALATGITGLIACFLY